MQVAHVVCNRLVMIQENNRKDGGQRRSQLWGVCVKTASKDPQDMPLYRLFPLTSSVLTSFIIRTSRKSCSIFAQQEKDSLPRPWLFKCSILRENKEPVRPLISDTDTLLLRNSGVYFLPRMQRRKCGYCASANCVSRTLLFINRVVPAL